MAIDHKEMLFVGGSWDGQRKVVDVMPYFRVAIPTPLGLRTSHTDFSFQDETYSLFSFIDGNGTDHEIYVHSSVESPMKKLLDGYHP